MNQESKFKASIKLSAIGDALGWITEFERSTESLSLKFGNELIDKFYPWKKIVGGRFYGYIDSIKAGSYSDDTQLLLAVARSIRHDGSLDNQYFAKVELINWLDYARGGGRTVKTAAVKVSRKSSKWFTNFFKININNLTVDYRQCGANGAAMRILPVALANLGNIEKIKEEIFYNSIITHGHPRAIVGALLYGLAIDEIFKLDKDQFTYQEYIVNLGKDLPDKLKITFDKKLEIKEWLKIWNSAYHISFEDEYRKTLFETQEYLRTIYSSIKNNHSVNETLEKIGCFNKETKGSGISTVIAGIYLTAKFNNTPLKSILRAVNTIGTDTDSIAAFTGGLIGALHGDTIIPDHLNLVQDSAYLESIALKLFNISKGNISLKTDPLLLNLKLLNNPKLDNYTVNEKIEYIPLGLGKVIYIDRQLTVTKGKYNLIVEAMMDCGQSIIVSKLFNNSDMPMKDQAI